MVNNNIILLRGKGIILPRRMVIVSIRISMMDIHPINNNMDSMVREVEVGHQIGRICRLLRIGITGIGVDSRDGIGGTNGRDLVVLFVYFHSS